MIIGYTTGVFDLFHIGHLKILNRAKKNCDFLIVGVTTDDLMMEYKKKTCVIPFKERSQLSDRPIHTRPFRRRYSNNFFC